MRQQRPQVLAVVSLVGVVVTITLYSLSPFMGGQHSTAYAQQPANPDSPLAALRAEIERLKQVVPDQAHAMQDVDYHFTNLWFAANQSNWDLAQFYWGETRSHLRWAVRIIPVRKDNAGKEIKLQDILQAVENTPLKQLEEAIKAKDREKFVAAYEFTLASC